MEGRGKRKGKEGKIIEGSCGGKNTRQGRKEKDLRRRGKDGRGKKKGREEHRNDDTVIDRDQKGKEGKRGG